MSYPCPQQGCLTKARSPAGCAAHRQTLELAAKEERTKKLEELVAELIKRVDSLETQLFAAQESMSDLEEELRAAPKKRKLPGKIVDDFAVTPSSQPSS